MAKTTPRTLPEKAGRSDRIIFKILIGIIVVWLIGLTTYTVAQNNAALLYSKQSANQLVQLRYETYKVQFCYEHDLKPCDDTTLRAYNAAHPDNERFNFYVPTLSL